MTFTLEQLAGNVVLCRLLEQIRVETNGCWMWTGYLWLGYGRVYDKTRYVKGSRSTARAAQLGHRASYELFHGPIPAGMHVHHLCGHRGCVNPAHLEAVTPAAHLLRADSVSVRNRRKTHCPQGHPYAGDNVAIYPDGKGFPSRRCRVCDRERSRLRRERKRAEMKSPPAQIAA